MKSDPDDLESVFKNLQLAESTKDVAEVKRMSILSAKLARDFIASPAATTVDLLATLEQENPKSKYLDEAYRSYFVAMTKT